MARIVPYEKEQQKLCNCTRHIAHNCSILQYSNRILVVRAFFFTYKWFTSSFVHMMAPGHAAVLCIPSTIAGVAN